VLLEAGLDRAEVDDLLASGVVTSPNREENSSA
jgi:hypothetical protein